MEDFGAKPEVPAHTCQVPSCPVRLPSSKPETAHSRLPPPISPKPRQVTSEVEYDDILTAKQYQLSKTESSAFKITSKPYKLEDFVKCFTLPQIVHAAGSMYGNVGQSKLEEVALLFSKTTKTVLACREGESYDVPLNSTFEFGPYIESSSHNYDTIQDLLAGSKAIPVVVKVLKSYKGKTEESSVVAGSLIFPQKLTSHSKKQKQILVCTSNHSNKTLTLGLSCAGNFSTHPSDVRMSLMQYISHIGVFPVKVKAFNYGILHTTKSYVEIGAKFVLETRRVEHSYIFTTDIFGINGYPLFELYMQAPISVQCIQHDNLDMRAILNKANTTCKNFSLSLINNHFTSCKRPSRIEIQDEFYKEVTLEITNTSDYFEITKPSDKESNVYECMSDYSAVDQVSDAKQYQTSAKPPPLPSARTPLQGSDFTPLKLPPKPKKTAGNASLFPPQQQRYATLPHAQSTKHDAVEQNKAHLQSLSCSDMLHLLDRMNLGQYKDSFEQEQVDGKLFVKLTAIELGELGIAKNIHQKRLLSLIDGTVPAKRFLRGKSLEDKEDDSYIVMSPQ